MAVEDDFADCLKVLPTTAPFNPPKNENTVVNTFSGGFDRMFCCVLRLEAFVLLLAAQQSGK